MEMTREQVEKMFAYARKFGGEGLDAPFARILAHDQAQREKLAAVEQERDAYKAVDDLWLDQQAKLVAEQQATIQRLTEERDTAKHTAQTKQREKNACVIELYQKLDKLDDLNLALKQRVATLEEALKGLLMSADAGWYANKEGHDWREAVDQARQALAPAPGGQPKETICE